MTTVTTISKILSFHSRLTHWGRVMHIWVSKHTNNGSDNGSSPGRRQAIIWTNAGILLMGPFGILNIFIKKDAFQNVVWKMAAISSGPQCVDFNDLRMTSSSIWWLQKVWYKTGTRASATPRLTWLWQLRAVAGASCAIWKTALYILSNL